MRFPASSAKAVPPNAKMSRKIAARRNIAKPAQLSAGCFTRKRNHCQPAGPCRVAPADGQSGTAAETIRAARRTVVCGSPDRPGIRSRYPAHGTVCGRGLSENRRDPPWLKPRRGDRRPAEGRTCSASSNLLSGCCRLSPSRETLRRHPSWGKRLSGSWVWTQADRFNSALPSRHRYGRLGASVTCPRGPFCPFHKG